MNWRFVVATELSFFPKELWPVLDPIFAKTNAAGSSTRKRTLQLAKSTNSLDVDEDENEEIGDLDSVEAEKRLKEKQIQRINAIGNEEEAAEEDVDEQPEEDDYDYNDEDDEMEGDYGENHFDNGEGDHDDGDGAGDEGGDFL